MAIHTIECDAIEVRSETGVCPGLANTAQGEKYIIDARTPSSNRRL